MKTILVPAGGGPKDDAVFDTALALARLFSAHLDFYHVRLGTGEAAIYTPHAASGAGAALRSAQAGLKARLDARSAAAFSHVQEFCRQHAIAVVDGPRGRDDVSASWREEVGGSVQLMQKRARYSDLVVMGRHTTPNGLPPDLVELLLLGCGRPVVIAPRSPPKTLTGTVAICWKESAEAGRAVSAAMPILRHAARVVVLGAREGGDRPATGADDLARYLTAHGIGAETRDLDVHRASTSKALLAAVQDCGADLVVMGAYGHSRLREVVFGGCTQSFIQEADGAALFMLH